MTIQEINRGFEFLRKQVDKFGTYPGETLMRLNAFVSGLAKDYQLSEIQASLLTRIFFSNDYLHIEPPVIILTKLGFDTVKEEEWPIPKLYLSQVLPIDVKTDSLERIFNCLWDLIGKTDGDNPYYVDGTTFYNLIKTFTVGLPPNYSSFVDDLRLKKKSTSRSQWCKKLFLQISKEHVNSFLIKLSNIINSRIEIENQKQDNELDISDNNDVFEYLSIDDFTTVIQKDMPTQKPNKVFISHNTKDRPYAKALVDLLTKMGLRPENIFCSSIPGYGVTFGADFIETIRHEYDNNNLIVLFIHSPRYYESPVSLNEMGATWLVRSQYRSFLTSDFSFDMMKGVVPSREIAFRADAKDTYHTLDDFKDLIEKSFNLNPINITIWNGFKDDFINTVESIPYPPEV